jgi:hypothetical protein
MKAPVRALHTIARQACEALREAGRAELAQEIEARADEAFAAFEEVQRSMIAEIHDFEQETAVIDWTIRKIEGDGQAMTAQHPKD